MHTGPFRLSISTMLDGTCGLDKNIALHCAVSVWVENDVDDAAQDSVIEFSEKHGL